MEDEILSGKLEQLNPSTESFLEMLQSLYQNNFNLGISSDLQKCENFKTDRIFDFLDSLKTRITKKFFEKAIKKAFFSSIGIYKGILKAA